MSHQMAHYADAVHGLTTVTFNCDHPGKNSKQRRLSHIAAEEHKGKADVEYHECFAYEKIPKQNKHSE